MSVFLIYVGLLGTIVSLVLLIICMIRRKPKKRISITLACFFVVYLVGTFTLPQPSQTHQIKEPIEDTADFQESDVELAKIPVTPVSPKAPSDKSISDANDLEKIILEEAKMCLGDGESVSVKYTDRVITINVDLGDKTGTVIPFIDLAVSRASSITDGILNIENIDEYWDSITIVFDEIGETTRTKDDINTNEYGGRFFRSQDFSDDLIEGQI